MNRRRWIWSMAAAIVPPKGTVTGAGADPPFAIVQVTTESEPLAQPDHA